MVKYPQIRQFQYPYCVKFLIKNREHLHYKDMQYKARMFMCKTSPLLKKKNSLRFFPWKQESEKVFGVIKVI